MSTESITAWELINPSDKIIFTGDNFELVAIAVCLLGEGRYGAEELNGNKEVPIFIFGSADDFFIKNFKRSFEESFNASNKEKLADVFDAFILGNFNDLIEFNSKTKDMDVSKLKEFKNAWNEKRSSLNNICGRAWQIADNLRINGV